MTICHRTHVKATIRGQRLPIFRNKLTFCIVMHILPLPSGGWYMSPHSYTLKGRTLILGVQIANEALLVCNVTIF